jgi:hypothetical protein
MEFPKTLSGLLGQSRPTFQNSWLPEVVFQRAKKPERPNVPANYKSNVMSGTEEGDALPLLGVTAPCQPVEGFTA